MRTIVILVILLFPIVGYSKCPIGMFSIDNSAPFYSFKIRDKSFIFCGYPGEENGNEIKTSEYDIFLVGSSPTKEKETPVLAFGAVDATIIYKSSSQLVIKDIWGGFTYTLNKESLRFEKTFSYEPSKITKSEYQDLVKQIESGQIDYTWPWLVLDAAILGYPGAVELFEGFSKYIQYSAAGSEEYTRAKSVYEAYKKNLGI